MNRESPREIERTAASLPTASTVPCAQAMAVSRGADLDASGRTPAPGRPGVAWTLPPSRIVYSWVTARA